MTVTESKVNSEVISYTVDNGSVSFCVMNFGCTITNLFVPDRYGKKTDVVLGYDDFDDWLNGTEAHNALVGRFANRIAGGKFTLEGKTYQLDVNNGGNCLHGGFTRWEKIIWNSRSFCDDEKAGVIFTGLSPEGEQGFPGNVSVKVIYSLDLKNRLSLEYFASTDKATPVNLTNHAYFNLNGAGSGTIENHLVQLNCNKILDAKDMIPTGRFSAVTECMNGTFDFTKPKILGKDIKNFGEDIKGYDHCFVTEADEGECKKTGWCKGEKSGIKMNIYTNQRGIQLYTGNWLDGIKGKNGVDQYRWAGVCFEAQRFPDSPNWKESGDCILWPGKEYHQLTVYEFITDNTEITEEK